MSDDNDNKETKLDKLCNIAWAYAGFALGTLLTILTIKEMLLGWSP